MIYDSTNGIAYSTPARSLLITNIDFQVKKKTTINVFGGVKYFI